MAIVNGMCVSFCNQPKAHLASPGYAPGKIAENVTRMKRGFNTCQTHRSMYSFFAYLQPFPSNSTRSSIVSHFSTFLPGYAPGTIAVNFTWMERGYSIIQCLQNALLYIPIYLQPFPRYSKLLRHFHTAPLFSGPAGVTPRNFEKILYTHKARMNGLSCGEESMTICSGVLIQYQRVTDGRTDRQTSSLYLLRASA